MPSKVQLYTQMADRTAEQVTGSYQKWTAFLTTAARLYKYPYNEQLMIFAQRPDATACAEYDLWNRQMRRYVRRGSRGIALVDTSSDQPKLRYVFDVSDTSGGENSRRPYLWEYRQEHREVVSAALEQRFDVSGENGLADQMERVAAQLVDEYWHDNRHDIVGIVDGSFLEDYDEFNIGAAFRNAAVVSTTYTLLSRCGMQPGDYFEHEDFLNVFDFNTPQTVAALGTAISQSSELVLRQIEVTIKNYEREKIAERSESHERTDLHPQRGLSDSRSEPDRAAASPAGQVWQDAEGLPEGASSGAVEQPAAVREAVPPSAGDRRGSEQPAGTDDAGADEVGRRDGSAESQRPDEVGRADEHAESAGRGNDPHGAGVQLTMFDAPAGAQMSFFPSEAEQIQSITEAESVTPSAFSMFISQDDIDHILRAGGNADAARMKIAAEFSKQKPLEDRAAFLKALYHGGNGLITDNGRLSAWYGDDGIHIATGDTSRYLRSAQVIGWADAAERIEELLDGGAFATNLEVTEAPRYERRGIAVDVWNLYHDFSDEAKSLGYLSCLGNIHSTSFPEETERLTDDLLNPEFRERLLSEYKVFMDAYHENRALLRFHYHRPQALLTRLEDLSLPRKEFRSDMTAVPKAGRFITEDEIAASLANGSGFEGGKTRIYEFFQTPHTTKESADFLKKEYGIGGRTHAVSRESGSYEDHGSKGIVLKKNGCADIQMNWNKVASRISELVRLNRYLTPDEQAAYDKEMAQDAMRNAVYNDYNDVKAAHPDEIVLYQVGDFFELYGEDARAVADDLSLELTRRNLEGVGRVTMCGFPAKDLEKYVEKLREKHDVTISRIGDSGHEHTAYTLPSIDHEAEQAINAYEAEFGADGTRVFRDPAADAPQPTVRELFDGYKLTVGNALSKDTAFVNACRNSDRQNAYLEGADAIRRIVTASDDLQLVRLYFDMPAFHNRLHQELLEELYPTLAATVAPSPYQITQEDIDNALLDWHNNLKGKQEVALYMQAHGRERSTAAWLAAKYGWEDSKTPMYIHVRNAEPVTLTWAQVQRRLAQLIRENKFYDENERLRLFSPDRYSIRLHPGEGGITGIWDEVLERFCGDGEQTLRFAEQNNAIAYLDGIKRDMGIELSPPAFTTPLGYTYHIGDRISSIELDHIAAVGVIARVDEDHVWHTLPNVPGQEPVSIDRNSFERYLDTRYFEVSEPEPQRVIAAQHTEQPTPETLQAVQNLMGQRVEIDGKLYNVDSADETVAHLSVISSSSESNHDPEHRTEPVSAVLTRIADQGRELAPNISAYQALRAEHPEKLIGVRVGERLLFYGADAKRAASALNRRLLQRDIPGMGETAVTGYDFGQWASAAKRLLKHGHSFVFAQPNETDGYDVINEADAKEYIPIGMELEIDGRKFVIDSVNFGTDEVSLRDVTFQNRQGFPIFRTEHIAFIRSFVEEQEREQPQPVTKPVAFYPAEKTHLPYDIEIQTLHIPEPEHDPPSAEPAKADMFHKRTIKQQRSVDSVDTASEALAVCIGEKACVDLDFMASLMGGSEKIPQIVEDLKGVIYKEPNSGPFDLEDGGEHWAKGWQTADEYLSGNVRQKLRTAQRVAARDPFFAGNVDALIAAQPKDLEASEIEVRLGATWLDKKYIEQFMYETFETPRYLRGQIEISYVPYTAEWQVSRKSMVRYNDVAAFTTYGTDRASAYRLLEDALNLRDIRIYDTIEDADGRERRVLNAKETTLAAQKQQLIRDAFKDWIWKDPERRETLVRQYNEEMNSTRPREYDGSHIVFSGMNPEITLREHQKNAIAHVLYGGNTLLAHEVGAGKTFEMVASAMESKRLGLCQKSIFVVPNHLTEQWASEFLRLYPSANILVTTKKDFETHNRKKFCARIATGDYDAVIIGHSQFETTKVNQCVANILQYWRDGEEEKLTQLVFCDISTPKTTPSQRAAKASPGTLDSPEIHALESAIPLEESSDTPFTVYEDVRQKLIDAGMPPEQIAFIHDANTEVKKRELFAKVRSGQVRVLMGSTAKMGAGTNVQDRLVALHDLDCPWRPRDLTQRKGRIERQGNQNKLVHVCRYVTEGTFDAYLWQTVENKQKFISQIMTSKSPVRSCEDVDATALSFAEIKALCAGDPRIKERMDLDIEVSKLKIMKADHNSKQFRLEDSLLKYFPEKIEEHKGFVRGLEADMQTLAAHPLPAEGFVGMEIRGDRLTDKENAGAALLDTCKEVKGKDPVQIGSYRGFTMSVAFDSMWKTYTLTLKGQMTHRVELGSDARGNLVRIENALDKMPERLRSVQEQLENLYNQQAAAKAEVGKPFPQEQELAAKTARLIELDMELNLDGKGQPQPEQAIAKSARPSVLDRLKASPVHGAPEKPHKKEMEAR